ncbi:MAG TPA: serine/threonine-protein kinase [Solirubrobacterales bacterium]|nr:serine/threonine-protein kinase [Solirubrobacterales bacterium]
MVEPGGWSELSAGDVFAGYRIEQRLGRGGMGILYLAVEPGLERRVALKLIAPEAAEEEIFARRFAEESRIAASIEHPNVVPIYAAGEEDGVPYIAMRYVAGSDLGRRIAREGRLKPEVAVALIAQVANGLDAIHAAGLVHRDVKPANVLLSGEQGSEHAYITDFGVARNVATNSGLTQTGRFVGTLDYVAPEQISGGTVDARVDVYALGCLLFKLLTGEVPFPREGEAARLYAHLNDPPPAPSLYVPAVGMALDDVVARAMAKQPGDRYPSAGDLGRAAVAALSGAAVAIPERTVATGAAATVEPETIAPTEATKASTPPEIEQPTEPVEPTGETGRLHPGPPEPLTEPDVKGPKRNPLLIGAALAAIAVIVVLGFVLTSSGGGGDDGTGSKDPTTSTPVDTTEEAGGEKEEPVKKPEVDRLTTPELIAQADAICATAKASYGATKEEFSEPETESGMNLAFAEQLVENSSRQVREMKKLTPPTSDVRLYNQYVSMREKIAEFDREAEAAAREQNPTAYVTAFGKRNALTPEMERVADRIGFEECSQNNAG